MSEHDEQEDGPRETEPNPTQEQIDEREDTNEPADVPWPEESD